MCRYSIKELSRTANERRAGSLGYAEAMLLMYNKKMRIPLDIYKLYNKPPERRKCRQKDVFDDDELQPVEDNLKFDFQIVNN